MNSSCQNARTIFRKNERTKLPGEERPLQRRRSPSHQGKRRGVASDSGLRAPSGIGRSYKRLLFFAGHRVHVGPFRLPPASFAPLSLAASENCVLQLVSELLRATAGDSECLRSALSGDLSGLGSATRATRCDVAVRAAPRSISANLCEHTCKN